MSQTLARLVASGGGVGYVPRAPGTAGSLLGLALGALLITLGHVALLIGILVATAAGLWAVGRSGAAAIDPGWIVIDEIAGQMIAMLAIPRLTVFSALLAFALFRFFDITKLGPVGRADAQHNAYGVMADDWIAGLFAAATLGLLVLITRTNWL